MSSPRTRNAKTSSKNIYSFVELGDSQSFVVQNAQGRIVYIIEPIFVHVSYKLAILGFTFPVFCSIIHNQMEGLEMNTDEKGLRGNGIEMQNTIIVQFVSSMTCDRLRTLSSEYNLPMSALVDLAVQRLLKDVDFMRNLRAGTVKLE